MNLYCLNYSLHYEAANIARFFFKDLKEMPEGSAIEQNYDCIITDLVTDGDCSTAICKVILNGEPSIKEAKSKGCVNKNTQEILLAQVMYDLLSELCKIRPPWGILTGIRPVKLIRSLRDEYGEGLYSFLLNDCRVSENKLAIALEIEQNEDMLLKNSNGKSVSIYVSIPFCPSRCNYCSFVSRTVEKAGKLIEDYIMLLEREIKVTGEYVRALNLKVESVYFGGGTPTVLTAQQLEVLLKAVNESFDLSGISEYTVEGGRPDTITEEKLELLKEYGVNRLSINPQTMNDEILKIIGRKHTADEIVTAYMLAKKSRNSDN